MGPVSKVLFLALTVLCAVQTAGAGFTPTPAAPLEPIAAIVDAFHSHEVVAIGDGRTHGDLQGREFVRTLISDSRFASAVDDIVVECCSARYQAILDRFVGGEDVPHDALAQLWRNSTQVNASQRDCDGCEQLFSEVRALDASTGRHRLRVLAGDPPIEWENVRTHDDYQKWLEQRDSFPARLIREEVANGRRVLVVYGNGHLQRRNIVANYQSDGMAATIVSLLADAGTRVFNILPTAAAATLQPDVASWPVPSLAIVRGTVLGAPDYAEYEAPALPRITVTNGRPDFSRPVPRSEWRSLRMEDQFDAILYLGTAMTRASMMKPDMCADAGYMHTLRERMAIVGLKPEIDRLNRYCASAG